ncbi:MAG: hypothetical protein QT05_C0015G0014 [archaeon GW2011_AR13]|nr:MAG: hypothetical protein QT05_C0015G0014 [archaeon GW2011_AR13]
MKKSFKKMNSNFYLLQIQARKIIGVFAKC